MTWTVTAEPFASADAAALRRDCYGEVAGRYWRRPATDAETTEGLADDGADLLLPPTGQFVVGRHEGEAAGCAGRVLTQDAAPGSTELTRVYVRPSLRGTGGGGLLPAAIKEEERVLGVRLLRLDTRLDLVEARGLYAKHGYGEVPSSHRRNPYAEVWFAEEL